MPEGVEVVEEDQAHEEEDSTDEAEFDADRALATIKKQRASERKLKAELAEARKAQDELDAIKQAQEDADKSASEKLAARDNRIKELEGKIAETAVRADFNRVAAERGIADLKLAYLAAKEQGLLGVANPKTGEVEGHDFDKLEELYPSLAGEETGSTFHGDAGVRSKGKAKTVNTQFNQAVRGSIRR